MSSDAVNVTPLVKLERVILEPELHGHGGWYFGKIGFEYMNIYLYDLHIAKV